MGHLYRSWKAARGEDRSALPSYERWEVAPSEVEGVFTVGRAVGHWGILHWSPLDGEHPHSLISGSSGGGKTSLLATWATLPALWNRGLGAHWGQTLILDPKGGAGYDAAIALGAEVVRDLGDIRDALQWAYEESEDRNRRMGRLTVKVQDDTGINRDGHPKKITDLNQDERDEHDLNPILLVIDEAADVFGSKDKGEPVNATQAAARRHAKELVQKARAAGVILAMGIVRPDAAILDGFSRAQMQARVAVGAMDDAGYTMMLGQAEGKTAAAEAETMDPGQAWVVGLGGVKVATRVYVGHTDLSGYLDHAIDPDLPPDVRAEILMERARRSALTDDQPPEPEREPVREEFPADLGGAPLSQIARAAWWWLTDHGPATRREVADGIGANRKTLETLLAANAAAPYRDMFAAAGMRGQAGLWRAAGSPPRDSAPRRGSWSRGVRGVGEGRSEEGWRGRLMDARAVASGPFVRLGLRVFALRLVVGAVKPGEQYRDPRVVWAAQDASSGRCRLCGRAGQLDVHHIRPLWAGGRDDAGNVMELCQRTAAPSCHGATTGMERRVRDFRRRIGTYQDGARPTPVHEVVRRLVLIPKPFTWVFITAAVAGRVYTRPLWLVIDVAALVLLGPLWTAAVAFSSRRDYAPRPDRGVDPLEHRQSRFEIVKAKLNPRKWRAAWTLRHHNRAATRDFGRPFWIRVFGWHLTGWAAPWLIVTVPVIVWQVVRLLVS